MRIESAICLLPIRGLTPYVFFIGLLLSLPAVASNPLTLSIEGSSTAHEGDQIEYSLEIENTGTAIIEGGQVLDKLPAMLEFVDAIATAGGLYDPGSGIWALPMLGTVEDNNSAGLRIQALVRAGLVPDPTAFATVTNRAEVIAPVLPETIQAQVKTNIVCAFCIDWEILSVGLDSEHKVEDYEFMSRFFLYVQVANLGPVASEGSVSVIHFSIRGGGFGNVPLRPSLPVPVSLDSGERQTIRFSTDWEEGPDSDYTISWEFEVSDVALMDPIMPNTVAGSFSGKVKDGGGSGGGGCSVDGVAKADPIWLLLLVVPYLFHASRNPS